MSNSKARIGCEEMKTELIEVIIEYRQAKGWSQTDLAKAIGSRQPVISCLERGECNPTLLTLQKIACALDLHIDVVLKPKSKKND